MSAYLLDTSAVLAHFWAEKGHVEVQALFDSPSAVVVLAAPALLELDNGLKRKGVDEALRRHATDLYGTRLAETLPVGLEEVRAAMAIRDVSPVRLPAMDALIAGCAAAHGAVLVHRDPHFDVIPDSLLKTWNLLDAKGYPGVGDSRAVVKERRAKYRSRR